MINGKKIFVLRICLLLFLNSLVSAEPFYNETCDGSKYTTTYEIWFESGEEDILETSNGRCHMGIGEGGSARVNISQLNETGDAFFFTYTINFTSLNTNVDFDHCFYLDCNIYCTYAMV